MNKNIDLGTFTWDTNKIENQIAANSREMIKFADIIKSAKKEIEDQSDAIKVLEKLIESERKTKEKLKKELENGIRSQESYNSEIIKSNKVIDELIEKQIELGSEQAKTIITQNRSEQSMKDLRLENNELNKLMSAGRVELSQNESSYRDLNKELNALKTEAKNLGAQMLVLENAGKKETEEYKQLASQFSETSKKANELNDKFKDIDKSVGDNQRSVGDYKDQIKEAASEITLGFNQMLSGNFKEGFATLNNGINGVTSNLKLLWAEMLANPMTALLVGVVAIGAGIALGVKEIFDYNASIQEHQKLVENLFGKTGKLADDIRNNISGLSKTFEVEFKDIANAVDNLMDTGVAKNELEALNLIKEGLLKAPDKNEFLNSLENTAVSAKQVGFDLEEVIAAKESIEARGINGEAVFGSLQKASQKLAEGNESLRNSMIDAFGATFTDDILKKITTGELTTSQALEKINQKSKEVSLNQTQQANLQIDLFGKQALAAGGFAQIMGVVGDATEKTKQPLTEIQQKTLELADANIELAKAKDDALKSDAIISFQKNMEILGVQVETIWYNIVGAVIDAVKWFDSITGSSELLGETWDTVREYASSLWTLITDLADVFGDLFDALGLNTGETKSLTKSFFQVLNPLNLLKNLYNLLIPAIKSFSNFIEQNRVNITAFAITAKNVLKQIFDAAMAFRNLDLAEGLNKLKDLSISKEFEKARKEAEKIVAANKAEKKSSNSNSSSNSDKAEKDAEAKAAEEARKKAEQDAKAAQTKKIADGKKAAEEAKKLLEEEAKRQLEIARETADQKTQIAKTELAEYISANADKYKDDKTLLKKKLDDQLAYYDEVKRLTQIANEDERKAKEIALQQKIDEIEKKKVLNQNDKNDIANLKSDIALLNREYATKDLELTKDTEEKKKQVQENYNLQVAEQKKLARAIQYQQELLELEENGANEYAIRQLQLEQETQQKLDEFFKQNELLKQLDNDNYISQQEIDAARKEIEAEIKATDDANEQLRLQNQLNSLNLIEANAASVSKKIEDELNRSKLEGRQAVLMGISQLFGTETKLGKAVATAMVLGTKAMAIADIVANTSKANAVAMALSPMTAGQPWVGINTTQAAISIASLVGQAAASIGQINGIKDLQNIGGGISSIAGGISQTKGFATGGLVNGGVEISRSNGDNRLVTVKDGEVILNEEQQSKLGGAEIFKIIGVPGFATGGLVGKPSNLPTVQNSIISNSIDYEKLAIVMRDAVMEGATIGTHSGSQSGILDLSENRRIANGANF